MEEIILNEELYKKIIAESFVDGQITVDNVEREIHKYKSELSEELFNSLYMECVKYYIAQGAKLKSDLREDKSIMKLLAEPEPSIKKANTRCENGIIKPYDSFVYNPSESDLSDLDISEPEWLIPGWFPSGVVSIFASDGGIGKTFAWIDMIAKISSGRFTMFESEQEEAGMNPPDPMKCFFLSAEDSVEYTLKKRLVDAGANMKYVRGLGIDMPAVQSIMMGNGSFEQIFEAEKPKLLVIDPLQAFIPPGVNMSARNDMRACIGELTTLCQKYGTACIIIMHTNKQSGVWGRKRIADSSDIWDISRSVVMMGTTAGEEPMKYMSHEKSNYGEFQDSVIFQVKDGICEFMNTTWKRDRDFVSEQATERKTGSPSREAAKEKIREVLTGGKSMLSKELEKAVTLETNISQATFRRAREDMRDSGDLIQKRANEKQARVYYCLKVG